MSLFKKTSVLAAVFIGLFVGSARAQGLVEAKVPFPFVVNGEQFPAGTYDIRNQDSGPDVLSIRGRDNDSSIFVIMRTAGGHDPAGDEPALVFTHHEGQYLLSQIWESDNEGVAFAEGSIVSRRTEAEPVAAGESTVVLTAHRK